MAEVETAEKLLEQGCHSLAVVAELSGLGRAEVERPGNYCGT